MGKKTLNDLRLEFFQKATGKTGSLQGLKYFYFRTKLGI